MPYNAVMAIKTALRFVGICYRQIHITTKVHFRQQKLRKDVHFFELLAGVHKIV